MANRGWTDLDDHSNPSAGQHDSGHDRKTMTGVVCGVADPTSVGEQVARGGWTRSDTPCGETDRLPAHRYQGGSADGGRYDVAAERGTSTPQSGVTY